MPAERDENGLWIDTTGGRIYVLVEGDGEPLLLLHGWALDHRMFAPQIEALSDRFRLVVPDRRGFGRSEAPPDLAREPGDVERILDTLGYADAHLLGMSQGGRIALRFATLFPKRVRSLLLQGAPVDGLDIDVPAGERVPMAEYAALAKAGRLDEVRKRWLAHPMMCVGDGHEAESRLLHTILADYEGRDLASVESGEVAFDRDVPGAMSRFARPALLLTGAHETPSRRRHAEALLEQMPVCSEVVFPNGGHLCNLTEAASYNAAVAKFCAAVDRASRRSGRSANSALD
jgi:pimeloyl-ACP methyl ester carboxylesterase